jgi:tetratricopeptide (TPR) repeat protein
MFAIQSVTRPQLDALAALGGFNPHIGRQCGNAMGAYWLPPDQDCRELVVRMFRAAIDAEPDEHVWHQGLGNYYARAKVGENAKAVECYAEAMKRDSTKPPDCALEYYGLLAELKAAEGDADAAMEALREGEALVPDEKSWTYVRRMAQLYEDKRDWEGLRGVYRMIIPRRPRVCKDYWRKLADAYACGGDWRGQLACCYEALEKNPGYEEDYEERFGKNIQRMAHDFSSYMLFGPAIDILQQAVERNPAARREEYQLELADTYMASRQFAKAAPIYKALLEGPRGGESTFKWKTVDLGHAYVGTGEFDRAIACYTQRAQERMAKGDYTDLAKKVAHVYMLKGDYAAAIRFLKADVSKFTTEYPDGGQNAYHADDIQQLYVDLGLCYEAMEGREADAKGAWQSALDAFEKFKDETMGKPDVERDWSGLARLDVRPVWVYANCLEKLGRREEAGEYYREVKRAFEMCTFLEDDRLLEWEKEEVARDVERIEKGEGNMGTLREVLGGERLERRLCAYYRTNYSTDRKDTLPRVRSQWSKEILEYEESGGST